MSLKQVRILNSIILLIIITLLFIPCFNYLLNIKTCNADNELKPEILKEIDPEQSLEEFIQYLVIWAFRLAGVLAFFMIVYAGFLYLTAGGNVQQQGESRERIFNAIIGLILLFSFWIILNTINPDILKRQEPITPSPAISEPEKDDVISEIQEMKNFVKIGPGSNNKYSGIPLSGELSSYPNGIYIHQTIADKLLALINNSKTPKNWAVTEACINITENGRCGTTIGHQSGCHSLGTCIDIGFGGDPGPSIRTAFITAANQAGFGVIDEYSPAGSHLGSGFHLEPGLSICSPTPPYYCI